MDEPNTTTEPQPAAPHSHSQAIAIQTSSKASHSLFASTILLESSVFLVLIFVHRFLCKFIHVSPKSFSTIHFQISAEPFSVMALKIQCRLTTEFTYLYLLKMPETRLASVGLGSVPPRNEQPLHVVRNKLQGKDDQALYHILYEERSILLAHFTSFSLRIEYTEFIVDIIQITLYYKKNIIFRNIL